MIAKKQAPKVKKTPPKRYKSALSVAKLLPKQLKNSAQKRGFQAGQIILNWPKICPEYAHVAFPAKLSHAGVLTLTVSSDSAKQEILLSAPKIILHVNGFLGASVATKIRCQTGVLPPRMKPRTPENIPPAKALEQSEKTCDTLDTSELKTALIKLGAHIYNKEK